jgi:hypothetical protein
MGWPFPVAPLPRNDDVWRTENTPSSRQTQPRCFQPADDTRVVWAAELSLSDVRGVSSILSVPAGSWTCLALAHCSEGLTFGLVDFFATGSNFSAYLQNLLQMRNEH